MVTKGIVYMPASAAGAPATERIANRPLVGLIIDALRSDGVEAIAVLAGDAEMRCIRTWLDDGTPGTPGVTLIELEDGAGLVDALGAAAAFVGDDSALVHYASGLLGQSAAPILDALGSGAADLTLLLHRGRRSSAPLDAATERLLGVAELGTQDSHLSLAGVVAFGPGAITRAVSLTPAVAADMAADGATPQQTLVRLADVLAERGLTVAAGLVGEWCEYSPLPVDLLELNRLVLDRQGNGAARPADDAGNRIEGRVVIDPTASVISSVILGPSRIGAHATISDAYIGPYTTIGAGAVIEGAEIVRSIVGDGARIAHLSGRIEGSTIGPGAHIFRDFTLPRALRLHVGENVEVSLD